MEKDVMQNENCNVVFESRIADWTEVNSSFDKGVLRIAYHGQNRNGMFISKQAFDSAVKSVFNCPVVCNYIRETDSIGSHDVDVVKKNGEVRMVNITTPVGVVPESANVWWSEVEEANGEVHEYLCADILIWKRQEAYEHLKENGIVDESMEIRVIDGSRQNDGLYHIDKFEFLAFCLLESAPPCFESAGIELFSLDGFESKYAQMMEDMKREFSTVMTASADDTYTQSYSKGGTCELDLNELMVKYSLSAEDVTFDTENMSVEEIEQKFSEIKAAKDEATFAEQEPENEPPVPEAGEPEKENQEFSLTASQFIDEVFEALSAVRYADPYWGDMCKYYYVDHDVELKEVYVLDAEDYKTYGMPFTMNGDKVELVFDQLKRKKVCYVDFDEAEEVFAEKSPLGGLMSELCEKYEALKKETEALKEFKAEVETQARKEEVDEVFAKFADLSGNAEFEEFRENYDDMSKEQVEEKCFAIRGRNMTVNFSLSSQSKPVRLPIEQQANKNTDEPYGGIFAKYGIGGR